LPLEVIPTDLFPLEIIALLCTVVPPPLDLSDGQTPEVLGRLQAVVLTG